MNYTGVSQLYRVHPHRVHYCSEYLLFLTLIMVFIPLRSGHAQALLAANRDFMNDTLLSAPDISELAFDAKSKHSVSCQKTSDLDFGGAFSGVSAGTVIISADPAKPRTSSGGVVLNARQPGYPAVIRLTITNDDHRKNPDHQDSDDNECDRDENDDARVNDSRTQYQRHGVWNTIMLPRSATLKRIGGTETMTADTYTVVRTKGTINIGATLHISANQIRGRYSGTFSITTVCD